MCKGENYNTPHLSEHFASKAVYANKLVISLNLHNARTNKWYIQLLHSIVA